MLQRFINYSKTHNLFSKDDKILLAISGGADSVVLADLLKEAGFNFVLAHCNFGLRGAESDEDEGFVRRLAKKIEVDLFVKQFSQENFDAVEGSTQMAARELRYKWFEELRKEQSCTLLATAHHTDDRIETFFINLLRGTGIDGLVALSSKRESLVRPLLFAKRSEIEAYAEQNKITYRTDSSNVSTKYDRNAIRHKLIPLLGELEPEFRKTISRTIENLEDVAELKNAYLKEQGSLVFDGDKIHIPELLRVKGIQTVLFERLRVFGFSRSDVLDIIGSLEKQSGKVFKSQSHILVKDRDYLLLSKCEEEFQEMKIDSLEELSDSPVGFELLNFEEVKFPLKSSEAALDFDKIAFPLTIRKWQEGDCFVPFGMKQSKKVSDVLINNKVSLIAKSRTLIIVNDNADILWVVGLRSDNRYRISSGTRKILKLVYPIR